MVEKTGLDDMDGSKLIDIISDPAVYHRTLIEGIRQAKASVILSALYIGTEKTKEKELIQAIAESLADESRPNLEIALLLDYSRTKRAFASFEAVFRPLTKLTRNSHRLHIWLYELLSQRANQGGIREKLVNCLPPQVKEVLGVYHSKFAVFDDKTAILTGANLSEEYFVQRQDRYYIIRYQQVVKFLSGYAKFLGADSHVYQHGVLQQPKQNLSNGDVRKGIEKLLEDCMKGDKVGAMGK
ncbi:hypothetical protein EON63_19640 [archaeon]|nr:MAG: hypothetical protein EON63_19640 [archaeon]